MFTLVHCRYKRSRYTNRKYLAEKRTPLLDPCSYTYIPVYNTKKLLDNTCINNEVNLKRLVSLKKIVEANYVFFHNHSIKSK